MDTLAWLILIIFILHDSGVWKSDIEDWNGSWNSYQNPSPSRNLKRRTKLNRPLFRRPPVI